LSPTQCGAITTPATGPQNARRDRKKEAPIARPIYVANRVVVEPLRGRRLAMDLNW